MASRQIFVSPKIQRRAQAITGNFAQPRIQTSSIPGPINMVTRMPTPRDTESPTAPSSVESFVPDQSRPKTSPPTVGELLKFPLESLITDAEELNRKSSQTSQFLAGTLAQLRVVHRNQKELPKTSLEEEVLQLPGDERIEFLDRMYARTGTETLTSRFVLEEKIIGLSDDERAELLDRVFARLALKSFSERSSPQFATPSRLDSSCEYSTYSEVSNFTKSGVKDVGEKSKIPFADENDTGRTTRDSEIFYSEVSDQSGNIDNGMLEAHQPVIMSFRPQIKAMQRIANKDPNAKNFTLPFDDGSHPSLNTQQHRSFGWNGLTSPELEPKIMKHNDSRDSTSTKDSVHSKGFHTSTPTRRTPDDSGFKFPFADATFESSEKLSDDTWDRFDMSAYITEQERLTQERGEEVTEDWEEVILAAKDKNPPKGVRRHDSGLGDISAPSNLHHETPTTEDKIFAHTIEVNSNTRLIVQHLGGHPGERWANFAQKLDLPTHPSNSQSHPEEEYFTEPLQTEGLVAEFPEGKLMWIPSSLE